jgi:PT repeat
MCNSWGNMVRLPSSIFGLIPLVVLGHDYAVETVQLSRSAESLEVTQNDPMHTLKVRVLAPIVSPATKSVVATRRLATARPTRRPTRKPTRRPTRKPSRKPSDAPSFEPTSFTIPPTYLFPVLPHRPTNRPASPTPKPSFAPMPRNLPTRFPVSLPVPIAPAPVLQPTSPGGPLQRFIQFLKRFLGISNPPSRAPVGAPTPEGRIVDLQLVKALSGELVTPLVNATVIYLNGTTPNYTIVAVTVGGPIRSVQFTWNSATPYRTEKIAPYTLCGGRSYNQCQKLQVGTHAVSAAVNGQVGTMYRVSFAIVNGTKTLSPTRIPTHKPTRSPTKPTRPPTRRPTRSPTRKPTQLPTPHPITTPTEPLPVFVTCPVDTTCPPGENLMQKRCLTQCVPEIYVNRKRRAGWRCGRCPSFL